MVESPCTGIGIFPAEILPRIFDHVLPPRCVSAAGRIGPVHVHGIFRHSELIPARSEPGQARGPLLPAALGRAGRVAIRAAGRSPRPRPPMEQPRGQAAISCSVENEGARPPGSLRAVSLRTGYPVLTPERARAALARLEPAKPPVAGFCHRHGECPHGRRHFVSLCAPARRLDQCLRCLVAAMPHEWLGRRWGRLRRCSFPTLSARSPVRPLDQIFRGLPAPQAAAPTAAI